MEVVDKFPLYPDLSDEARNEAQALINRFKEALKREADAVLSEFYQDITWSIQSDAWSNFRNKLVDGITNYQNRHLQGDYDFAKIRKAIYAEHREELIKDMNADLLEQVKKLQEENKMLRERYYR